MIRVAINGFGRIGRLAFRLMEENEEFEVVAINDLTDAEQLAYLLKYDTNHRNYRIEDISNDNEYIIVGERRIRVYAEKDPSLLPWKDLDIDVVFECTGLFTSEEKAMAHINALKEAHEQADSLAPVVFKPLDIDAFIKTNSSPQTLKRALAERDQYYSDVADASALVVQKK